MCKGQRINQEWGLPPMTAGKQPIILLWASSPLSSGWGSGQVWLDHPGKKALSVCEFGNQQELQSEVRRILNCYIAVSCSVVKAATPQGRTTLPWGSWRLSGLNSQSPKRNRTFSFSRGHCLCTPEQETVNRIFEIQAPVLSPRPSHSSLPQSQTKFIQTFSESGFPPVSRQTL